MRWAVGPDITAASEATERRVFSWLRRGHVACRPALPARRSRRFASSCESRCPGARSRSRQQPLQALCTAAVAATGALFRSAATGRRRCRTRLSRRVRNRKTCRGQRWTADGCEIVYGEQPVVSTSRTVRTRQGHVALLLNRNAKGVTTKIISQMQELAGLDDCFVCCSLEDAAESVREVLDRGIYTTLACGGGDGTLVSVLNLLDQECVRRRGAGETVAMPAVAVLRLGTGNGLSGVVLSRRDAIADVRNMTTADESEIATPVIPVSLVTLRHAAVTHSVSEHATSETLPTATSEEQETHCLFAGLGYDARMLRDYEQLRARTASCSRFLRNWVHSPLGYVMALIAKTLPATLKRAHVFRVRIVSLSDEAFYVDPVRGDVAVPRPRGSVLFEGEAGIVCMSTVPFYGGGVRLFPFAGMPGGFLHLRISNINPVTATLNMYSIWRGSFRSPRDVHDFLVHEALIEVDRPVPMQHSGELVGEVERLHVCVKDGHQVNLVDFHGLGTSLDTVKATPAA